MFAYVDGNPLRVIDIYGLNGWYYGFNDNYPIKPRPVNLQCYYGCINHYYGESYHIADALALISFESVALGTTGSFLEQCASKGTKKSYPMTMDQPNDIVSKAPDLGRGAAKASSLITKFNIIMTVIGVGATAYTLTGSTYCSMQCR